MTNDKVSQKYWNANPNAATKDQWTGNPFIAEEIYRRMSGGISKHWLNWLLEDYFKGRQFKRMLSPGCGVGDHEIIVAEVGRITEIDAFDLSESSLGLAREKARKRSLTINFYKDNVNTFTISRSRKYDLIICSGSLHHVKELERFFEALAGALEPGGYFVFNEYVGDCYNIYSDKQVGIINTILSCFPRELRSSDRSEFHNPTIEQVIATDPSESVRSKLILPLVRCYFDVETIHRFGGCILHPLYPFLDHNKFVADHGETRTILRLLLAFEDILIRQGAIESDFALCVCRPK